ncbi:hypothetical protein V8B97DRAFT_1918515 [Scleroderma yunnanense]
MLRKLGPSLIGLLVTPLQSILGETETEGGTTTLGLGQSRSLPGKGDCLRLSVLLVTRVSKYWGCYSGRHVVLQRRDSGPGHDQLLAISDVLQWQWLEYRGVVRQAKPSVAIDEVYNEAST